MSAHTLQTPAPSRKIAYFAVKGTRLGMSCIGGFAPGKAGGSGHHMCVSLAPNHAVGMGGWEMQAV